MRDNASVLILGGGISGLSAARALQKQGVPCLLLERCPSLGGYTRSIEAGDFCFDYTGHLLHLSRFATPAEIPYAGLRNEDWQRIVRRSCCYIGGKLVTAPVQYHLAELPARMLAEAVASYESRPSLSTFTNVSFEEYIVSGFGRFLADVFLIPQNEKTMAIPLKRLSMSAVKRFFPPPKEAIIRAGMRPNAPVVPEYNSQFWYPKAGGIRRLVDGLRAGLENVAVCQEAVHLDLDTRILSTKAGDTFGWKCLLSSIPLRALCLMSDDKELLRAGDQLSHSATVSFNIGLRGTLPNELKGVHWIYVPDRNIPFYRVGCYSNISNGLCASGHYSLYVEVGIPGEEIGRASVVEGLQPRVLEWLERLGWAKRSEIVCIAAHVLKCAYVHHTRERELAMGAIEQRLAAHGVYLMGRYGQWDYTSMEDSIISGIATAEKVAAAYAAGVGDLVPEVQWATDVHGVSHA